eukprot:TRINITY_DN7365_c0_g1_i12.p1 TRINITY_DN7365_c0_g1~~TRINITY_DN7365_c0_g1_i12.p1  ORF type:complete len:1702 (-),score=291.88 TRINITY_DN7365_c0_g1_i12:2644-7599(-)
MAETKDTSLVDDDGKLFETFLNRGKAFGFTAENLSEYVDKQMKEAHERQDRLLARREELIEREKTEIEKAKLLIEKAKLLSNIELAKQKTELEREIEKAKLLSDIELAKQKTELEREIEKAKLLSDIELAKRQTELDKENAITERERIKQQEETRRLQMQADARADLSGRQDSDLSSSGRSSVHGPKPTYPKIPSFKEKNDDVDSYLFRFETHATNLKWPKEHWLTYLSALLEGTALTLYHSLAEIESLTYDILKENLLKKFQCTPDGFRKRFRDAKPSTGEPFDTYAVELRRLIDRWVSLSKTEKTYEGLMDLILAEQLLESVSRDLVTFLCEKDERKFNDMVRSAESYRRAHPSKSLARKGEITVFGSVNQFASHSGGGQQFIHQGGRGGSFRHSSDRGGNHGGFSRHGRGQGARGPRGGGRSNSFGQPRYSQGQSARTCWLCKGIGHSCRSCPWKSGRYPCWVCNLSHARDRCPFASAHGNSVVTDEASDNPKPSGAVSVVCSVTDEFSGQLHLESGSVNGSSCSVLRDTGATVCGVRKRLVTNDQYLGTSVKCVSFGGRVEEFPLAKVEIESQYLSGSVVCCVLEAPVADFIVGNVPGVRDSGQPGESGGPFCMAAITRARGKHVVEKKTLSQVADVLNVTPEQLSREQKDDASLKQCFALAQSGEVRIAGGTSHFFHVQDGILFRTFVKGTRSWEQVVVPTSLRSSVLVVSHDLVLAGHCGGRRTLARLRDKFFWPGVTVDVAKFVASCDVCQRTVSKGKVSPVPLGTMPVISTPFHRVAIDLVGPISPVSEGGHRYILTLIDVATRYPEAAPLRNISSVDVAEALLVIFSRLGFPKEILSDQGTQFNSELMKQFHTLCGCHGIKTSPYHPQGNGTVERFHGTLKAMLRKVIQGKPKLWHRYLPALLFACRELPSESTGFSPFMLLFGREVRGPLTLLQESWTGKGEQDEESKPLYGYIFDLQNILAETSEIARENSVVSSARGKKYFDRKAKQRYFQVGDQVLVLLPSSTNKLLANWLGPFPVIQTMHPDYKILMKGKVKVFHANMLKRYVERKEDTTAGRSGSKKSAVVRGTAAGAIGSDQSSRDMVHSDDVPEVPGSSVSVGPDVPWSVISPVDDSSSEVLTRQQDVPIALPADTYVSGSAGIVQDADDAFSLPTLSTPMTTSTPDESVDDVKFDESLSESGRTQLKGVLHQFADILTTKPGCFSGGLEMEIPLVSDVPVRRRMYNAPFSAKEIIEREIQTMLDLEVIEHSKSPYTAPVVLVQKKDGSCRFCIDYRWLNKITEFDAEPIPDVEALFAALGGSRFFSRIDLAKGYWQIPVRPEDRSKTAFATHMGLFQFVRMPFGLVSAPAVFARMMRMLQLEQCSAVNFFDDILVHSADWRSHLLHVEAVLSRLREFGLTARPSKIEAGFQSLEFLGHVVGEGTLRPAEKKVQKILHIPTPATKKQVRSLLGLISFYRRYIPNFATLSAPLSDLTKDGPKVSRMIEWTPKCTEALQQIQAVLSAKPVLLLPRLDAEFVLRTDASSVGLGAVLLQEVDEVLHPVAFASKKLLPRECNYSTIERECLAIVWGIQKFVRFLWGVRFVLQTDHRPLTYLRTSSFRNGRILRWALSLQEFMFDIQPISGTSNVLADLLSRASSNQTVP